MAYESLQPHYTTLSDGSLSLLFCEWRNHLHALNIANFTPTYLTHCIHSPFTVSHRVKRFLSQVRNLMVSCGMHAGPLFFLIPAQKQGQYCKFVWMTWHSHSTVQLSLHLWAEGEFTHLSPSFHPHPQQCMDPNGVLLWLPSSTTVAPLDPNEALETWE